MSSLDIPTLGGGGLGGVPTLGGGGLGGVPTLSGGGLGGIPSISRSRQLPIVRRAISVAETERIMERLRNREIDWRTASRALSTLPSKSIADLRDRLFRTPGTSADEFQAVTTAYKDVSPGRTEHRGGLPVVGGVQSQLTRSITNTILEGGQMVRGMAAGAVQQGKALDHDTWNLLTSTEMDPGTLLTDPKYNAFAIQQAKGAQAFYEAKKDDYGDIVGGVVHGDMDRLGRGLQHVADHPLQPMLDALAIASLGTAAYARIGLGITAARAAGTDINAVAAVTRNAQGHAVVGDGIGSTLVVKPMGRQKPGMYTVETGSGSRQASRFFSEEEAIRHAQSVRLGGLDPDAVKQVTEEAYLPARGEVGMEATLQETRGLQVEHFEAPPYGTTGTGSGTITPDLIDLLHDETRSWASDSRKRIRPGQPPAPAWMSQHYGSTTHNYFTGPRDAADSVIHNASSGNSNLITVRDSNGQLIGLGDYQEGLAIEINWIGAKEGTGGAPIAIVQEIARRNPGKDLYFVAANQNVSRYYEAIGAERESLHGSTFVIKADKAEALARGEPLRRGSTQLTTGSAAQTSAEELTATLKGREKKARRKGFAQGLFDTVGTGPKGNLIEKWQQAKGITHQKEHQDISMSVLEALTDPADLETRQTIIAALQAYGQQVTSGTAERLRAAGRKDVAAVRKRAEEQPGFFSTPASAIPVRAAVVALRETSDFVRASAIFLRPAYAPNNWAGNAFLNAIHQGVYAPMNLANSFAMDSLLGKRYTRALDNAVGFTSGEALVAGEAGGYVSAITDPIATLMGKIGDLPFRRAALLHELRKMGYKKLRNQPYGTRKGGYQLDYGKVMANEKSVEGLLDLVMTGDEQAMNTVAEAGRRAQEEIIKFGKYNQIEKSVLRHIIFVYSWMRGAARYGARFPFAHPIQASLYGELGQSGQEYLNKELGGVPSFLIGAIPVGRATNGNPILVNPFTVNPLGSGIQVVEALSGTVQAAQGGKKFNKFAEQDIGGLLNPALKSYLESREGGRSVKASLTGSLAWLRTIQDLQHPGRGGVYPTSRTEAVGQFAVGALFPREASAEGIKSALERQRQYDPIARLPDEIKDFQKATGQKVPADFRKALENDLRALQAQSTFKTHYAQAHGRQGFTNMPAQNQAEAALDYLKVNNLVAPTELQAMEDYLGKLKTESEYKQFSNVLWAMSGVGTFKRAWDEMKGKAAETNPPRRKIP